MNERIKELADQVHREYMYPWDQEKAIEKFAQLIVQECAEVVEGFVLTEEVSLDEYVDYEASDVLKKHFGVEE
jgi:NTP pyrophosphatase (non-canonical NTP hydrolase)